MDKHKTPVYQIQRWVADLRGVPPEMFGNWTNSPPESKEPNDD